MCCGYVDSMAQLACKAMMAYLTSVNEQPCCERHWRSRRAGAVHCAAVQQDAHRAGVRLECGFGDVGSLVLIQCKKGGALIKLKKGGALIKRKKGGALIKRKKGGALIKLKKGGALIKLEKGGALIKRMKGGAFFEIQEVS
jgi:hypothetical protein